MSRVTSPAAPMIPPRRLFPLIRHASRWVSPTLASWGASPNAITFTGLTSGVAAAVALAGGTFMLGMLAAALLAIAYLMDHCDGEVARLTGRCTAFGKVLDDVADWVLHAAFFVGLGIGAAQRFDEALWLWLGAAAAAGGTINSIAVMFRSRQRSRANAPREPSGHDTSAEPSTPGEHLLFGFRELVRADFWLLVVLLQSVDELWLLLPAGAISAQIYWIIGFAPRADRFSC